MNTSKLILLLLAFFLLNCAAQNDEKNKTKILEIDKLVDFYTYFTEVNLDKLSERKKETGDINFEKLKKTYAKENLNKEIIIFFNENFSDEEINKLHKSITSTKNTATSNSTQNQETTITPEFEKKRNMLYEKLYNKGIENFNELKQKLYILDSINYNKQVEIVSESNKKVNRIDGMYETLNYNPDERIDIESITLKEIPSIEFKDLKSISVKPEQSPALSYSVQMIFNEAATKKLSKISNNNIYKPLVIVINQKIVFAPIIRHSIDNGNLEISGNTMSYNKSRSLVDLILKQ